MRNYYKEFHDYIDKLNVDVTIEICLHDLYWYLDCAGCDDWIDDNEFPDFDFYPYNPFDEPPIQINLTFFEYIEEKVIYNKDFDINNYTVPESEISEYIHTWNDFPRFVKQDDVIPFLNEKFPEHYANLIRKEKIEKILNGSDEPLK